MDKFNLSKIIPIRDINLLCVNAYINKNYMQALKYAEILMRNINSDNSLISNIQYYFNHAFVNKMFVGCDALKNFIFIDGLAATSFSFNDILFDSIFSSPIILKDLLIINRFIIGELYLMQNEQDLAKKYLKLYELHATAINKYYPRSKDIMLKYYEYVNDEPGFIKHCVKTRDCVALLNKIDLINSTKGVEDKNTFIKNVLELTNIENYESAIINKYSIDSFAGLLFIINKLIFFNDYYFLRDIILKYLDAYSGKDKITLIYYLLEYTYSNIDKPYCMMAFDIHDTLTDSDKEEINTKFQFIVTMYNDYYFNIDDIKYKKFLTKDNKSCINHKLYDYCKLKKIFENHIVKDKCNICYNDEYIIILGCHDTHIVCIDCFEKIKKCPYCRDPLI